MCKICQGTGFRPMQSSPGNIIIEPCPECAPKAPPEEKGWKLNLTFNTMKGPRVERPLISVSANGTIKIEDPLTLQELAVVVNKNFPNGSMWQAVVLLLSEVRRLQDRVTTLENMLGE